MPERYSLEQAEMEAGRLNYKMTRHEAKTYPEAEKLVEYDDQQAELVIADPESVIRSFLLAPIPPFSRTQLYLKDWMATAKEFFTHRLAADKPLDFKEFEFLRRALLQRRADSTSSEMVLTAGLVLELEKIRVLPPTDTNKQKLFHLALDYIGYTGIDRGILGAALRKLLEEHYAFAEVAECFLGKDRHVEISDLVALTTLATNTGAEGTELNQELLNKAVERLTSTKQYRIIHRSEPTHPVNLAESRRFLTELNNYPPAVSAVLIARAKAEKKRFYQELVDFVWGIVTARTPVNTPDDPWVVGRYQAVLAELHKLLARCPELRADYEVHQVERERQQHEAQRQRVVKERREHQALVQAQIDRADLLITNLDRWVIDPRIATSSGEAFAERLSANVLISVWPCFVVGAAGTLSYDDLRTLSHTPEQSHYLDRRELLPAPKMAALSQACQAVEQHWRAALDELLTAHFSTVVKHVHAEAAQLSDSCDALTPQHKWEFILKQEPQSVPPSLIRLATLAVSIFQETEATLKLREEYGVDDPEIIAKLQDIESNIDELKARYAVGTGLNLGYTPGQAGDISETGTIGSVSYGRTMRLELNLRQEQRLHLELFGDNEAGLEIEIGRDRETIAARRGLIDWVVPHETAHTVDDALGQPSEGLAREIFRSPTLYQQADEDKNDRLRDYAADVVKEAFFDGIGFRLITEFGTSHPEDQTRAGRITRAIDSFALTTNAAAMLCRGEHPPQTLEMYTIQITRFMAVVEYLAEVATQAGILPETEQQLLSIRTQLEDIFNELTASVEFITAEQHTLLKKEFFQAVNQGSKISWKQRSTPRR